MTWMMVLESDGMINKNEFAVVAPVVVVAPIVVAPIAVAPVAPVVVTPVEPITLQLHGLLLWIMGSYQIYAMPVFDMIETRLVKKLNFAPSFMLRFITRNVYVALTMFIGICIPFFGGLLGFFGGFAFAPTTYFLPCIIWLAIYKPTKWGLSWMTNWICIVFGVALTILSPIGGLTQIILDAKTYKFFN
ncbi:lysine histidine transporter 1-like protein [Tanacetum coccineum]